MVGWCSMGTFNDPCRMCQVMPYRCGAVLPASPGSAPVAGPALSALALEIRIQEVAVRGTALHGAVLGDGCPEASTRDVATRSRDVPTQSFMVLIEMLEGVAKLFASGNLHGFTVSVYCVTCFFVWRKSGNSPVRLSPLRWSVTGRSLARRLKDEVLPTVYNSRICQRTIRADDRTMVGHIGQDSGWQWHIDIFWDPLDPLVMGYISYL